MKTMKMLAVALVMVALPVAANADVDLQECGEVAGKFHANPFAMTRGQLQLFVDCGYAVIAMKEAESRSLKDERISQRNFGNKRTDALMLQDAE